jgi:hypothetical protein
MTDTPTAEPSANPTRRDAEALKHDAERGLRHALSHLEDEFLAKLNELGSFSRAEANALLAWIAGNL